MKYNDLKIGDFVYYVTTWERKKAGDVLDLKVKGGKIFDIVCNKDNADENLLYINNEYPYANKELIVRHCNEVYLDREEAYNVLMEKAKKLFIDEIVDVLMYIRFFRERIYARDIWGKIIFGVFKWVAKKILKRLG